MYRIDHLLRLFLILFSLTTGVSSAHAYEGVLLTEVSQSKKTFKINLGTLEGVEVGEIGRFYINVPGENPNSRKLKEVVSAEAVKSSPSHSFWYVREAFYYPALEKSQKLLLFRSSKVLKGRRKFKVHRKKIVFSSDDEEKTREIRDTTLKNYKRGFPGNLIKNDQNYWYARELKDTNLEFQEDIEVADLKVWKTDKFTDDFNLLLEDKNSIDLDEAMVSDEKLTEFDFDSDFNSIQKRREKEKQKTLALTEMDLSDLDELTDIPEDVGEEMMISEDDDLATSNKGILNSLEEDQFDLLVKHGANQISEKKFELSDIQEDSADGLDDNSNVKLRSSVKSLKEKSELKKLAEQRRSQQAKDKIARQGESWSADLSDKQLRRFIERNGLEKEKARQSFFSQNSIDNELAFSGGLDIVDKTSVDDTQNGSTPLSYQLAYEFYFSRLSMEWAKWTLETSLYSGTNTYDLSNVNGQASESLTGFTLKYFFVNHPTTIEDYAFYVGLGYKTGEAAMTNPSWSIPEVKYTMTISPRLELGFKYRYKKYGKRGAGHFGLGFFGNFAYDLVELSTIESAAIDLSLFQSATYNSFKMNFGLGFYF